MSAGKKHISDILKQLPHAQAPADFEAQLRERIAREKAAGNTTPGLPAGGRQRTFVPYSIAASIALMLLVTYLATQTRIFRHDAGSTVPVMEEPVPALTSPRPEIPNAVPQGNDKQGGAVQQNDGNSGTSAFSAADARHKDTRLAEPSKPAGVAPKADIVIPERQSAPAEVSAPASRQEKAPLQMESLPQGVAKTGVNPNISLPAPSTEPSNTVVSPQTGVNEPQHVPFGISPLRLKSRVSARTGMSLSIIDSTAIKDSLRLDSIKKAQQIRKDSIRPKQN